MEENRVGRALLFKKAREAALSKTRGNYPAAEAILDVVREGADNGSEAGYAAEAKRFGELVQSAEADASNVDFSSYASAEERQRCR